MTGAVASFGTAACAFCLTGFGGMSAGISAGSGCSRTPSATMMGHVARRSSWYGPIFSTGIGSKPSLNAGESGLSR
jgi:hypothetical protein